MAFEVQRQVIRRDSKVGFVDDEHSRVYLLYYSVYYPHYHLYFISYHNDLRPYQQHYHFDQSWNPDVIMKYYLYISLCGYVQVTNGVLYSK